MKKKRGLCWPRRVLLLTTLDAHLLVHVSMDFYFEKMQMASSFFDRPKRGCLKLLVLLSPHFVHEENLKFWLFTRKKFQKHLKTITCNCELHPLSIIAFERKIMFFFNHDKSAFEKTSHLVSPDTKQIQQVPKQVASNMQSWQLHPGKRRFPVFLEKSFFGRSQPIGSMGLVYLPIFTIEINQM